MAYTMDMRAKKAIVRMADTLETSTRSLTTSSESRTMAFSGGANEHRF